MLRWGAFVVIYFLLAKLSDQIEGNHANQLYLSLDQNINLGGGEFC